VFCFVHVLILDFHDHVGVCIITGGFSVFHNHVWSDLVQTNVSEKETNIQGSSRNHRERGCHFFKGVKVGIK
jgi:hypothetical protein